MPRSRRGQQRHPLADPGLQRQVERLIAESRDSLPNDADLDRRAQVGPADEDAAVALWDQAQRAAATGLEGLLSAKGETD